MGVYKNFTLPILGKQYMLVELILTVKVLVYLGVIGWCKTVIVDKSRSGKTGM